MHTNTLLHLAMLAGPALALPSPPHRQFANTTSPIPGIAQTSTEPATVSSETSKCTAEYILPNSRDCGEIALAHGIQLGVYESYFPSHSKTCQGILRSYGICPVKSPTTASPPAFPTATPVDSVSNFTLSSNGTVIVPGNETIPSNATLGINGSNFTNFDASVLATGLVTFYDTTTLTYTIGTGGAADLRTIVITHTSSSAVTFTTMATVVGTPDESKAKPTSSPTLVPARVVLQVFPEGTSTITTEFREHGTYTALTTVAAPTGSSRVNSKRDVSTSTCVGEMAMAIEAGAAPVNEKRQVPTCANAVSAPAPTASGAVVGCSEWHVVVPGESCATIAMAYGIEASTFKTWNPALDATCYNLLTGIAYCVSRCGLTSDIPSTDVLAAATKTSATVLSSKSAFQDGMWTPATLVTTSAAVAGMYKPSAVPTASAWMASGYAPKSYASVAPKHLQSSILKAPTPKMYSGMAVAPKSTQSAVVQASRSMAFGMGAPEPFLFPSIAWQGFGSGNSFATSSLDVNALPSASSKTFASPSLDVSALPSASSKSDSKPLVPFMAPVSLKSSPKLEVPTLPSSKLEVSKNYSSSPVAYKTYSGDGSVAAGWPSIEDWLDFETMFEINKPDMLSGCATWNLPNDSEDEIASIKSAIKSVAAQADDIDERFILAIIMQESKGCVRVITTSWAHNNPGLMQTHQGTGSCNTPTVQTPCPDSEILQMVRDGTLGTATGDGLQQCKQKQASGQPDEASAWYRTARQYNGGSIAASGNLEEGCCTLTYASDVANRLTGWVHPPSTAA